MLNDSEDKHMHLQIQYETLQMQHQSIQTEKESLETEIGSLRLQINDFQKQGTAYKNQVLSLESQLKALQDRLAAKQSELRKFTTAAPDAHSKQKELEQTKSSASRMKTELDNLKDSEKKLQETIMDLQGSLNELEAKNESLSRQLAVKNADTQSSQARAEKAVEKSSASLEHKTRELAAAKSEITRLREELEAANAPSPSSSSSSTVVATRNSVITGDGGSSEELNELRDENENLKKFLGELKNHYTTLRDESLRNKELAWKEIQSLRAQLGLGKKELTISCLYRCILLYYVLFISGKQHDTHIFNETFSFLYNFFCVSSHRMICRFYDPYRISTEYFRDQNFNEWHCRVFYNEKRNRRIQHLRVYNHSCTHENCCH